MMKNILTILVCSIVFSVYISCTEDGIDETGIGSLKGVVVNSGDNEPLDNVKITTSPASTTVFTDAEGKFEIEHINEGEYSVKAEVDEYVTAFEATNITTGNTSDVVFEMELSTSNNDPPTVPILIAPEDNGVVESSEVTFVWSASDPNDDPLTFKLELRNDQNDNVEVFENVTDTTYTYSTLTLGTKYFWQVSASDEVNEPVLSALKSFSVISSPTENRFLFVRNINGNNVIFSADEEGNEFQLTAGSTNSFRPRKNVAANRVAYLQTTGAQVDIFTMNLDGTEKYKVTSAVKPNGFDLNEINIAWPPNTSRIYFPSLDKLYIIGSNGQGLQLIYQTTDGSLISEVAVSENDNLIVLKTNDLNGYNVSVFTISFNGNIIDTLITGVQGAVSGLDLSVTNKKVIYSYDVSGFEDNTYRRLDSRIFMYDLSSGITIDISEDKPNGTNDLEPIFSPNEAFVVYTNTSNDGISQKDIYQLEIDVEDTRTLLLENGFMPDWE